MRVAVLFSGGRAARERNIANALQTGAHKMGWQADIVSTADPHQYDLVAGYGWGPHRNTFESFKAAGKKYVFVDLGFWDRKPKGNRLNGLHKVTVNEQQPTVVLGGHKLDRLQKAPQLEPWKRGGKHIVLGCLSPKAAPHYGFGPGVWERGVVHKLRKHTDLPIMVSGKPAWGSIEVEGATTCHPDTLNDLIRESIGFVSYKSNACVDAIAMGVPIYCEGGAGLAVSAKRPEDILSAPEINEYKRREFLAAVSYTQWTPQEMSSGEMFHNYKDKLC